MDFKKCDRCGSFFVSASDICENCAPKDRLEFSKFRNYLTSENCSNSINAISIDTGISVKNLTRYLENKEIIDYKSSLTSNNSISINL